MSVCLQQDCPRTTTSETLLARRRNRIQEKADDPKRKRNRKREERMEKEREGGREGERERNREKGAKKGTRRERARRVSDVIRKCLTRLGTTRQVGTTNREQCEERASWRTASRRSMTSRRVRAGLPHARRLLSALFLIAVSLGAHVDRPEA